MFEKIGQGKFEQISFILNYVESELVLEENAEMHGMLQYHHSSRLFAQCQDFEIDPNIPLINPNENEIYSFVCLKQTMRCETCGLSNLISNLIRFILAL